MKFYTVDFSVSMAYSVIIEAASEDDARAQFEIMYEENNEDMQGSEYIDCEHTVHHITEN
jgi:hypothetical protein